MRKRKPCRPRSLILSGSRIAAFSVILFSASPNIAVPRLGAMSLIRPNPHQEISQAIISLTSTRPSRPPLVYLYFDVKLTNEAPEPLWYFLPSNLGVGKPLQGKAGVNGVEISKPHGTGSVLIGYFLGTGGCRAVQLAAHSTVTIHNFPLSYWGSLPAAIDLDLQVANDFQIGVEPSANWFGPDSVSSKTADVALELSQSADVVRSRNAVDNKEQPLILLNPRTTRIHVTLDKKE